jgi:hypothetical protein
MQVNMKRMIAIVAVAIGIASCTTSADRERDAALKAQQYTIDSIKTEMAKKHIIDSMNAVAAAKTEEKATSTRSSARRSSAVRRSSASSYTGYSNSAPVYTQQPTTVYQEPAAEPAKKGWSAKAKGALIGAGAGAITGAAVSKDQRAKGAVIGGVLGAGAGLGVGAIIDKKNGR